MTDDAFGAADGTGEEWADVRMTDPEEGEWDVDVVVQGGRVEYVDLRVKTDLLTEFVACLVDDVGAERAAAVLASVAEQRGVSAQSESGDRAAE
jgi:hypothetical protein